MKVSVAMCTYNGAKYLREQLCSIINQSNRVDEIVICDDGSTDSTLEIISQIRKETPEIQIYVKRNVANLGSNRNFLQALSLCRGDVIFLSDQDDVWLENKVEIMLAAMEEYDCDAVFSDGFFVDSDSKRTGTSLFKAYKIEEYLDMLWPDDFFFALVFNGNMIPGASMAVRKIALEYITPCHLDSSLLHDYWILLSTALPLKLRGINEKLFEYRLHDRQQVGIMNYGGMISYYKELLESCLSTHRFSDLWKLYNISFSRICFAYSFFNMTHATPDRFVMKSFHRSCDEIKSDLRSFSSYPMSLILIGLFYIKFFLKYCLLSVKYKI